MLFQFLTLSLAEKTLSITSGLGVGVGWRMPICLTVYALICEGPSVTAPAAVSSRSSGYESTARSIHEVSWLDLITTIMTMNLTIQL
jgi:hypothetical protein